MKDYRIVICLPLLALLAWNVVSLVKGAEWGALAVVAVVAVYGLLLVRSRAIEKCDALFRRQSPEQ